ncbi:HAMP domain-containing sensor histidine kinase [Coralliovum pocilloporae]|uniref:HAMP domain-containing sensor histidine kinase n=1 Tax=Coralliovum pocilloporae TaxID=3066369 RepID=UPI003307B055
MAGSEANETGKSKTVQLKWSLSTKLLLLTIAFIMLSEVLIFIPSAANFRNNWLKDKVAMAAVAAVGVTTFDQREPPRVLQDRLLAATGAHAIAVRSAGLRRLVAMDRMPSSVDISTDLREIGPLTSIMQTFETLFASDGRTLLAIGTPPEGGEALEVIMDETPLRADLIAFSINILQLSLIISFVTAALVYISLRALFLKPMEALTHAIVAFRDAPEDKASRVVPTNRTDEIGLMEQSFSDMQEQLSDTLHQQKRLADLGLAVSKINHDLRNILASAQLFSDRLSDLDDPLAKRIVPKIFHALDRAVNYTKSVMDYGKAQEAPPSRRRIHLRKVIDDIGETLALGDREDIDWYIACDDHVELDADPEQLFRAMLNLCRNAIQAMESDNRPEVIRRLSVYAMQADVGILIRICDTGPGVPEKAKEKLFQAFQGSVRQGGTGLGLAIASELIRAHDGTLRLVESDTGATFEIFIPMPEQEQVLAAK